MDATGWSRESLELLAAEAADDAGLADLAGRACALLVGAGVADRVCVIELVAGSLAPLAASDARAGALATWQSAREEGPSVDACRRAITVRASPLDARHHRRWPSYAARAAAAGVHSLWSVPMLAGERCAGAIEGHAGPGRPLGEEDASAAGALAAYLGVLVVGRQDRDHLAGQAGRLHEALRHSILVEQAKGRLAERHGMSIGQALELLRAHATAAGVPLHQVARDVLEDRRAP